MFTRIEHPVHRDVNLNAGERETGGNSLRYCDLFTDHITKSHLMIQRSRLICWVPEGTFEIPTLEGLGLPLATTSHQGR